MNAGGLVELARVSTIAGGAQVVTESQLPPPLLLLGLSHA